MELPTTTITHDGTEYTISFRWAIVCDNCDHITRTASDADRITCSDCRHKNTRDNIIGKYFEEYLKYSLFTGNEETTDDVTDILQHKQAKYEAMQANGWTLDCTTGSSHVAMSKGDIPPQNITA